MMKLKLSLVSMLILSFMNFANAAEILVQEEFTSSSQFKIMGSGVSIVGGKAQFAGAGVAEFEAFNLPAHEVNDFEVSLKVKFKSLTDSARFAYQSGTHFFAKSGKSIILNLIVAGKFESINMANVIADTSTEYAIRLRVTPGLAIGYVNNVEKGRKVLAADMIVSTNKSYIGGTPWGNYLNGTADSYIVKDMSEGEVVGPTEPAPNPTDPSVNSPDARFVSPSGNDANDGSLAKPYKTVNGAVKKLLPGNILFLRAGVYRESVDVLVSGTPEKPIYIRNYPNEVATMNGGLDLKSYGLQKLAAAEPALAGNPNWKNFHKVIFPASLLPGEPEVVFGNRFMKVAQTPNQPHDLFMKGVDFTPITLGHTATTYIQHASLAGKAADYWTGKVLDSKKVLIADYQTKVSHWSHLGNNEIFTLPITASSGDQVSAALKFPVKVNTVTPSSTDGFAIVNHPSSLDQPGEFMYYKDAAGNIVMYIWPYDSSVVDISVISKVNAFHNGSNAGVYYGSHIKYQGLEIKNYGAKNNSRGGGVIYPAGFTSSGVSVKNMNITNIVGTGISLTYTDNPRIENNVVSRIKDARGITVGKATNARIIQNTVDQTERTGIYSAGSVNTLIMQNSVGKQGLHGNGISAYQGDIGVVIYRNRVDTENIPITIEVCNGATIINNIATTKASKIFASWGRCTGNLVIANNLFYSTETGSLASIGLGSSDTWSSILIANNITSGGLNGGNDQRKNNIYLKLQWNESAKYGWTLGAGDFVESNTALLFKNLAAQDFTPPATSPSIDKGLNISASLPHANFPGVDLNLSFDGVKRGARPDIGPYEIVN